MHRRRPISIVVALLAVAALPGCGDPPLLGRACTTISECAPLACLDRRCAPALEDPGGPARATGSELRAIAVGIHPTLDDAVDAGAWRAFVRALFEREVSPVLATDRPNLVVFPGRTLLPTAFGGLRGADARAATTATDAIAATLGARADAVALYAARFDPEPPAERMFHLVSTDAAWRALEPFRELARERSIHVVLGAELAMAERSTDPAAIAALVDESETDRSFAWVATTADVHDRTIVIGPDGEIVHAFLGAYLPPASDRALVLDDVSLASGGLEDLRAIDLPFARVAATIGRDASMPDVIDRLALDGAALLLQPAAIDGWAVPQGDERAWPPDVVQTSGWSSAMRHPEFQASVMPCWSGNLFDLAIDCQSTIVAQARQDATRGAWIGRDDEVGVARVAPWAIADDRLGTIEERRARLAAHAARLLPGSGDPIENAYAAGTVHVDLDLARGWPVRTAPIEEIVLAPSDSGEQRRPAIVATGEPGSFAVLWEDTRRGRTRIYGALGTVGDDDVVTIGEARVRVATTGEPRRVRAAARADEVHVVWQEDVERSETGIDHDAMHAVSRDGARSFGDPVALGDATALSASQWTPDIAIDTFTGDACAVWIDRRRVGARARAAIGRGTRLVETRPVLPDREPPYTTRANHHLPAVAMRGAQPWLVWADFGEQRWRIRGAAYSADLETWDPAPLDDADVPFETIHSEPRLAIVRERVVAAWTDLRERRADHDVRVSISTTVPSIDVAPTDDRSRPQWRPSIAARELRVVVVWQDARADHQAIRFAVSEDGGATFAPDAPLLESDDLADRYGPEVVWIDDRRAVVAYESTASGARRIAIRVLSL